MRGRWVVGGLVAVAAFALSVIPGTFSAPTQNVDVNDNQLSTGTLRLNLQSGPATVDLSFPGLLPGEESEPRAWLAANDSSSPVAATLMVTFDRLHDSRAGSGALSQRVELRMSLGRPNASHDCATAALARQELPQSGPGNLRRLASGDQVALDGPDGSPLVLAPGEEVCLATTLYWAPSTADNAAEGATLTVRARFYLTQVHS